MTNYYLAITAIAVLGFFLTIATALNHLLNAKADKKELARVERQAMEQRSIIKQDFKDQVYKVEKRLESLDIRMEKGFDRIVGEIKNNRR